MGLYHRWEHTFPKNSRLMSHEFDLIRYITELTQDQSSSIELGIGDDCAVWNVDQSKILLATDMLIEEVHFDLKNVSYEQVGRKALAVNLSDVAAMGGKPTAALVSLGIPVSASVQSIQDLMYGLIMLSVQYDTVVVGGDTTSHDGPLIINVAITGVVPEHPVVRSGAKEGDSVFVTGALGGSLSGHHWSFQPRLKESNYLTSHYDIHSMIDLSDGLASDIRHISQASVIGCILNEDEIPISDRVDKRLSQTERLHHALSDGEDFELLFTVCSEVGDQLKQQDEIEVHEIGVMQGDSDQVLMKNSHGELVQLPDAGWKHHFS